MSLTQLETEYGEDLCSIFFRADEKKKVEVLKALSIAKQLRGELHWRRFHSLPFARLHLCTDIDARAPLLRRHLASLDVITRTLPVLSAGDALVGGAQLPPAAGICPRHTRQLPGSADLPLLHNRAGCPVSCVGLSHCYMLREEHNHPYVCLGIEAAVVPLRALCAAGALPPSEDVAPLPLSLPVVHRFVRGKDVPAPEIELVKEIYIKGYVKRETEGGIEICFIGSRAMEAWNTYWSRNRRRNPPEMLSFHAPEGLEISTDHVLEPYLYEFVYFQLPQGLIFGNTSSVSVRSM